MSKLVQCTDIHSPDLSTYSNDNLNNMKIDLHVSLLPTKIKLSANNQSL